MDIYLMLKAVIMGLVEGATEFIPVSSTGHLIITGEFLDFLSKDKRDVFEIIIQLGAILAVCVEYRQRLWNTVQRIQTDINAQHFVRNLIIAFLPAALIGLALHHQIKQYLFSSFTVGIALVVGGILILLIEKFVPEGQTRDVDQISAKQALQIGFAQSLALFPGMSRSGSTILGGMYFGLNRQTATEFSFFLALPIMFAATGLDLYQARDLLSVDDALIFLIGFVVSLLSSLVVIRALIRFVAQHSFAVFAWYRIAFGILILAFFAH